MKKEKVKYGKKNPFELQDEPFSDNEAEELVANWTPLKKCAFSPNFKFLKFGPLHRFFAFCFNCLAVFIVGPIVKIKHGVKVYGKKNLRALKKQGKIVCCNHSIVLDQCVLQGSALFPTRPFYICNPAIYQIPVVRRLIRLMDAVPVPFDLKSKAKFFDDIDRGLKIGRTMIIFPEGSMWPYYNKLRTFKKGAFSISVRAEVPIVPIVLSFKKPKRFNKFLGRKKPTIVLTVCKPISPKTEGGELRSAESLMLETREVMEKIFLERNSLDWYQLPPALSNITETN
ncbi:MAG: 1-acyl-sn-glycerol-3-phosphate acyltransferase [Christensenellaceae bacterium]|jgi:1-acyl-sn-glycerol-3-phosphate acyltransferase|nr:1-acyl-sn-glycerol-3-phosphate acyltransferase [Christensenellaceae bacterium]